MIFNQQVELLEGFEDPDFANLLCGIDELLVIKFFHYFSRFEHALKLCEFKKIDGEYVTGADWSGFAVSGNCPRYPTRNVQVDTAVRYICRFPVKRQRGNLTWRSSHRIFPYSLSAALKQIPYIRNNLFHGGKFLRPNVQRDTSLLNAGICLMQYCLAINTQLYENFLCTDR